VNVVRGIPRKIIWIKTGNLTTRVVAELLNNNIEPIKRFLESDQPESYLTKPFKEADLVLSVEIALKRYFATHPEKYNWVLVKENEFYTKLPAEAIDYFESIGNYLNVVSNGKLYKCRSTIKEMLTLLPARLFIQTHRAFIVNKRKISKFNAVSVHIGELRIPVSEKYAKSVMQKGF